MGGGGSGRMYVGEDAEKFTDPKQRPSSARCDEGYGTQSRASRDPFDVAGPYRQAVMVSSSDQNTRQARGKH